MSEQCCAADGVSFQKEENNKLKKVFWVILLINLAMFFVEFIYGVLSHSNALTADSLDMLGDTFVYGISLFVISKGVAAKAKASLVKGVIMAFLGFYVIGEAVYKIIQPILPTAEVISIVGIIALIANATCFLLLLKYKSKDLNTKSAWICSRNDIMGNVCVIIAGLLVGYF